MPMTRIPMMSIKDAIAIDIRDNQTISVSGVLLSYFVPIFPKTAPFPEAKSFISEDAHSEAITRWLIKKHAETRYIYRAIVVDPSDIASESVMQGQANRRWRHWDDAIWPCLKRFSPLFKFIARAHPSSAIFHNLAVVIEDDLVIRWVYEELEMMEFSQYTHVHFVEVTGKSFKSTVFPFKYELRDVSLMRVRMHNDSIVEYRL